MSGLLSMTGFGTGQVEILQKTITVELRTLNSKSLDLNLKIHPHLKPFEYQIRNLLSEKLSRGKIDCNIKIESASDNQAASLNWDLLKNYVTQLRQFAEAEALPIPDPLQLAFRLPQVFENEQSPFTENEWTMIEPVLLKSVAETQQFRKQEGEKLTLDIRLRNENILNLLEKIISIDVERKERIAQKLKDSLNKIMKEVEIDKNRLEQELIFYIERADITEEIIRLKSHNQFFENILNNSEAEKGKKLGFIAQEMGREINTIGSKAAHAEMQKNVVAMKDELEKIKEQINNVL